MFNHNHFCLNNFFPCKCVETEMVVTNYQPVRPEVTLSSTFLLVTSTALVLLNLLYWSSFAFFVYISTGTSLEPLYGFKYYWLSSTYCLLASFLTLQRLWKLAQSGPTALARLGLSMLTVAFIEYLLLSNVFFSKQQVDDLYGNKCFHNIISLTILLSYCTDYNLQSVFISVSSAGRMLCATLVYFLLRNVLKEVAWDVGDPLS